MAKRHETYVLTRANNRTVIEAELERLQLPDKETPKFIYVDLSAFACRMKRRGILPTSLYYLLWQFKARRALDSLNLNADVIHHVTFCSFVVPGVWWNRREKVVLGPLGGASVCAPQYLRLYSPLARCSEWLRGWSRKLWRFDYFYVRARNNASAILFTEKRLAETMCDSSTKSHVVLDVAVPHELEKPEYDESPSKMNVLVWAGTLSPHKAGALALRAFARAFKDCANPPSFEIFGIGPDRGSLGVLVKKLGIEELVRFRGSVPQEELWEEIRNASVFVFTSVRDTCGCVAVEALACQTPVICFNHQGVSELTDASCAIRIDPKGWDQSINGFADGMRRLVENPKLARQMGASGRKRVLEKFAWDRKFADVDQVYRFIVGNEPGESDKGLPSFRH